MRKTKASISSLGKTYKGKKRLRLSVFRSNKYIYAQIIDDEKRETLAAASDLGNLSSLGSLNKTERAKKVGKILAEKALKMRVRKVYFDRGRFKYHGRIKSLSQGAREGGLDF